MKVVAIAATTDEAVHARPDRAVLHRRAPARPHLPHRDGDVRLRRPTSSRSASSSNGTGALANELRDALDGSKLVDAEDLRRRRVAREGRPARRRPRRRRDPRATTTRSCWPASRSTSSSSSTRRAASPAGVRSAIAQAVADQGAELQAAIFTSEADRSTPVATTLAQAQRTAELFRATEVGVVAKTVGSADEDEYLAPGIGYQAPSNLILFVFITSVAGSALLIQSRQLRVTQRMYATPTNARTIVAGETLARFAIAGYQALLIVVAGIAVLRRRLRRSVGRHSARRGVRPRRDVRRDAHGDGLQDAGAGRVDRPDARHRDGDARRLHVAAGDRPGPDADRSATSSPTPGRWTPGSSSSDAEATLSSITTQLAVLAGFVVVLLPLATWRLRRSIVAG